MKYIEQHIAEVERIFEEYKGREPLHLFLKKYFKRHRKFGSRDRRNITECLYGLFRMGRENRHLTIRQRVYFFLFLKGELGQDFFEENYDELSVNYPKSFEQKLKLLQENYELRRTFRAQDEISSMVDLQAYRTSYYREPLVYIRLRNDSKNKYQETILAHEGVSHGENIVSFPPKAKLDTFLDIQDYVVQDINSQRTADYFPTLEDTFEVWDCCAGSGGKSILFLDKYPDALLTVTDIRVTILRSLMDRFRLYNIEAEVIAELNVNKEKDLKILDDQMFDFIICDVPCTGSGTWARTPEQFYYFDKKEIKNFQKRQLDILSNASKRLKKGRSLLYITCSVFAKENEEVVEHFLASEPDFSLTVQQYLDGTTQRSDTLYVAQLSKN